MCDIWFHPTLKKSFERVAIIFLGILRESLKRIKLQNVCFYNGCTEGYVVCQVWQDIVEKLYSNTSHGILSIGLFLPGQQ